mgnify:CR=1 FL=1
MRPFQHANTMDSFAHNHHSNISAGDQPSLDENVSRFKSPCNCCALCEQYLSQTMRNLADKAFELSKKHNLKDEVKLIQEEEKKLEQYLLL